MPQPFSVHVYRLAAVVPAVAACLLLLSLSCPRLAGQKGKPELTNSPVLWIILWDEERDRGEFVKASKRHRAEDPGFSLVEERRLAIFGLGGLKTAAAQLARVKGWPRFEKGGKAFKP